MSRLVSVLALLACLGCNKADPQAAQLPGDDVVVAKVNQSPITLYDLDAIATRTLGDQVGRSLDANGRRKVLESMVQSRAVAQLAERELGAAERAAIDKRVSAFREELLVQAYLEAHFPPKPVTGTMVREYYDANRDRFGGKRVLGYELIASQGAPQGKARETLLAALQGSDKSADFAALAASLQKAGHAVDFRRGNAVEETFDPQLRQVLQGLREGQSSNVIMLGGRLYVLKVVEDRMQDTQPLEQVADQIRKTLSPLRAKEAVKGASQRAMKQAQVEYPNAERLAGG